MTRRETLIAYLLSSVEAEDWHAVRDAAVDIEVLDAKESLAAKTPRPATTEPVTASEYYNRIEGHGPSCGCDECVWFRSNEMLRDGMP